MRNARMLVVVGLVAIAGIVIWRCHGSDTTSSDEIDSTDRTGSAHGRDPITGAPRWFGQLGVNGRRIAGVVVDGAGTPMRGVVVRLASKLTIALRTEPSVKTDDAGRFDFGTQVAVAYVVAAEVTRMTGATEYVDLRDASVVPDQLRLILHPCTASIHGTIRDSAGGVVGGASISHVNHGIAIDGGIEADANGAYELCVHAGGAFVRVGAEGYASIFDQVNVFGRTRRDFALVPGATVMGRVVRAGDRAHVAGAVVELRSTNPENQGMLLSASSDTEGRFEIEGVTPGRHLITAVADQLATERSVEVVAEIGTPANAVIELSAAFTVSGRVIDGDQAPLPGVSVFLNSEARSFDMAPRWLSAITQADGGFVVEHVLPGEYRPWVQSNTEGSTPPPRVAVTNRDVSGVVIESQRGATISGRVLHGNKPIDGATVNLRRGGGQTKSAHDGSYTLRNVPAGTHQIYAESHRVGAFTQGPMVTVAKGEHKTGVDLPLELSSSIAGVVIDQNDAPVAGVFVSFALRQGRDFGQATTADDGTFAARSMSGGGDYGYEVRERANSGVAFPPATNKRHQPIAVADGNTHITGVRIKIRVERLAIAGRVVDAAGKPVPDVTVRAIANERGWYRMPTGTSDTTGAFTIRDLPPGKYSLTATSARGDAQADGIVAGRADVALRIEALGAIDGTLEGFTDHIDNIYAHRTETSGADYRYRGMHRATITGKTFQLRNLPAGEYRVGNSVGFAIATVAPGKTATVVLRQREIGTIEGTVLDEKTRKPIAGIHCMAFAGKEDYTGRNSPPITDANGVFRSERATVGVNQIWCGDKNHLVQGEVTVVANQVARVELLAKPREQLDKDLLSARGERGHAGLTTEFQFGEHVVKSVEPAGPAARAGVKAGDTLLKIDDTDVVQNEWPISKIEHRPLDKPVKLTLERNDKQLTVTFNLGPPREQVPED